MSTREAFLAGMVYAAGPRTANELIQNPDARTDIELILDQIGAGDLTPGEELMRAHGIAIVR